uniref:Uncharacterized protein n=1 Tax=Arundo donax TaxID=35708 RepID=A0A0A9G175_ARUDO
MPHVPFVCSDMIRELATRR